MPSRSRRRYFGAGAKGNASTTCWVVQPAEGASEIAMCRIFRRSWAKTTKTKSTRKVTVGTVKKSTATICEAWLRRNVVHVCDVGRPDVGRYLRMVESETFSPSLSSSSRMRGLPQVGFAVYIRWINLISFRSLGGRPSRCRDRPRQYSRNPARCQRTTV